MHDCACITCAIIDRVYNKNTIEWSRIYYISNYWINYYMRDNCSRVPHA